MLFPWRYIVIGAITGLIYPPLAIVFFALGALWILVGDETNAS